MRLLKTVLKFIWICSRRIKGHVRKIKRRLSRNVSLDSMTFISCSAPSCNNDNSNCQLAFFPWRPRWSQHMKSRIKRRSYICEAHFKSIHIKRFKDPDVGPTLKPNAIPDFLEYAKFNDRSSIIPQLKFIGIVARQWKSSKFKFVRKTFFLDSSGERLFYLPSKKKSVLRNSIWLTEVVSIQRGFPDFFKKLNHSSFRYNFPQISEHIISFLTDTTDFSAILFSSKEECAFLYRTFLEIQFKMSSQPIKKSLMFWVDCFNEADKDGNASISLKELQSILQKKNIALRKSWVMHHFQEVAKNSNRRTELTKNQFLEIYKRLGSLTEEIQHFLNYAKTFSKTEKFKSTFNTTYEKPKKRLIAMNLLVWEHGFLTSGELQNFLQDHFKTCSATYVMAKYEVHEPFVANSTLSFEGYLSYLMSNECSLFALKHESVHQNMTFPLSYYYINSSHNTYLEGNQITSAASIAAYRRAFERGCKCVELDIWDGKSDEPVITHGHTLTSSILFKDVVQTINDHGFCLSPYPVILSFENHTSENVQKKMVYYLTSILQDKLYVDAFDGNTCLPSPEELKYKVIIKAKKKSQDRSMLDLNDISNDDDQSSDTKCKELSDLINICQSTKFRTMEGSINSPSSCIYSLSESTASALCTKPIPNDVSTLSRNHLIKVYPSGTRIVSSNYDPLIPWKSGCQIVTLNFQSQCSSMWLNDAMFRQNGNCGYVLKPSYLLGKSDVPDCSTNIDLEVISALHLPKPNRNERGEIIDPYVRVRLYEDNKVTQSIKTSTVIDNGFYPVWNHSVQFTCQNPDFSYFLFEVYDEDTLTADDFIGQFAIFVSNMQEGYAWIPLFDKHGRRLHYAMVFLKVHIDKQCNF